MDATWPKRSRVHFTCRPTSTTTLTSVWLNRSGRWRDGNGSLHDRASTLKRYHITSPPGDVFQPTHGWCLLVTYFNEVSPVSPTTLLICLENLCTLVEFNTTLCLYLADIYRGKFFGQNLLQVIAINFSRYAPIRILDQHTFTLEKLIMVLEALSIIHG